MTKSGIAHHFQTVTGGDQVENPKPAPDIYHLGATAAHRSGAMTVQVPDIKPPTATMTNLGHVIAPSIMDGAKRIGILATP